MLRFESKKGGISNTPLFNNLKKIKAFNKCIDSIKCVEDQTGGDNNKIYTILYFQNKLAKFYNIINLSSVL